MSRYIIIRLLTPSLVSPPSPLPPFLVPLVPDLPLPSSTNSQSLFSLTLPPPISRPRQDLYKIMSFEARQRVIAEALTRPTRNVEFPKHASGRPKYPSEIFGENVFTLRTLQFTLPKPVYAKFIQQIKVHICVLSLPLLLYVPWASIELRIFRVMCYLLSTIEYRESAKYMVKSPVGPPPARLIVHHIEPPVNA